MKFPRVSRKLWLALGLLVFAVIVFAVRTVREPLENSGLKLVSATYGGNCRNAPPKGNADKLFRGMDGRAEFSLSLRSPGFGGNINLLNAYLGDPASGCFKELVIEYTCNGTAQTWRGDERSDKVELKCAAPPPPPAAPAAPAMTSIEPLVRDGTIKNYTACVTNPTLVQIAQASPQPGDDPALNKTRYGLCSIYYANPAWIEGQPPGVDDRKPEYGGAAAPAPQTAPAPAPAAPAPSPAPAPAPAPTPAPAPSAPPSIATYSASCSKCSVVDNQITCACDVLPK